MTAEKLNLLNNLRKGEAKNSPLVYFVHGRAGNLSVMSSFMNVLPRDYSVISVQGIMPDAIGGYSWWDVNSHGQEVEQQQEKSVRMLIEFMSSATEQYNLEPAKTLAFGFSQGAGLLSLIAQTRPDLLDGVALLSGFVIERSGSARGSSLPEIFMAHGELDETIPLEQAIKGREYLQRKGYTVEFVSDEKAGHKVGIQGMRALKKWADLRT